MFVFAGVHGPTHLVCRREERLFDGHLLSLSWRWLASWLFFFGLLSIGFGFGSIAGIEFLGFFADQMPFQLFSFAQDFFPTLKVTIFSLPPQGGGSAR
jgi:hypothetical protein